MIGLNPPIMELVERENEINQCITSLTNVLEVVDSDSSNIISCTFYYIKNEFDSKKILEMKKNLMNWINNENILLRIISVSQLPRNSLLEVQLICKTNKIENYNEEEDDECEDISKDIFYQKIGNIEYLSKSCPIRIDYCTGFPSLPCVIQIHLGLNECDDIIVFCNELCQKISGAIVNCGFSWASVTSIRLFYLWNEDVNENFHNTLKQMTGDDFPATTSIKVEEILFNAFESTASIELFCYK